METFLLSLSFVLYIIIRYYMIDHEAQSDKDYRRFKEGIELFDQKKYDEAFRYFDQAAASVGSRESAVAYLYRARCHYKFDNPFAALVDLTRAQNIENTLAVCHLERGIINYEIGEFSNAYLDFDRAVWHFHRENAESFCWRAMARWQLQKYAEAESDFKRAIKMGDEYASYQFKSMQKSSEF